MLLSNNQDIQYKSLEDILKKEVTRLKVSLDYCATSIENTERELRYLK